MGGRQQARRWSCCCQPPLCHTCCRLARRQPVECAAERPRGNTSGTANHAPLTYPRLGILCTRGDRGCRCSVLPQPSAVERAATPQHAAGPVESKRRAASGLGRRRRRASAPPWNSPTRAPRRAHLAAVAVPPLAAPGAAGRPPAPDPPATKLACRAAEAHAGLVWVGAASTTAWRGPSRSRSTATAARSSRLAAPAAARRHPAAKRRSRAPDSPVARKAGRGLSPQASLRQVQACVLLR